MIIKSVVVGGAGCLKAKSAAQLVYKTGEFMSEIMMVKGARLANGKSLLGVLSLVIGCGDVIELKVNGLDEEIAVEKIAEFLQNMPD